MLIFLNNMQLLQILNKLVVHHNYQQGSAWDCSRNNNHGHIIDISTFHPYWGVCEFDRPSSKIIVPYSSSLENLKSIRVKARFLAAPDRWPGFKGSGVFEK